MADGKTECEVVELTRSVLALVKALDELPLGLTVTLTAVELT